MKKIVVLAWLSLDGYFSGPAGETGWFVSDEEIQQYLLRSFSTVDTILMGQVTYNLFVSYWPTPASLEENPVELIDFMNNSRKIVFSSTLQNVSWNNAEVIKSADETEIKKIKQGAGKDIIIFGSGSIVSRLTKLKLIDEYRFIINPVFLGTGKTIFKHDEAKSALKLADSKRFGCGNMLLQYELKK
ncbi:MAG: dihydrofolate reductase family protein [Ferruginibacter sp.]